MLSNNVTDVMPNTLQFALPCVHYTESVFSTEAKCLDLYQETKSSKEEYKKSVKRRDKADSLSGSSAVAVALLMVRTMQRVPLQLLWIIGEHLLHVQQRFGDWPLFQSSPFLPHKETQVSKMVSLIPIHLYEKCI